MTSSTTRAFMAKKQNLLFNQLTAMPKRLAMVLTVLFTLGVGSMWGADVTYTLDGTVTGGSNGYATSSSITQNNVTWSVVGNTTESPWRIGGKSLTNTDRTIASTTTIASNISKVVVTHGTASSVTVNSLKLIVASDANFSTVVSTVTGTFTASNTTTFTCPNSANWTDRYYKIVYNITISSTSNKYLQFKSAEFYGEASTPATRHTVTFNAGSGTSTASLTETSAGAGVTLPTATICDGWEFAGWKETSAVAEETTTEPKLLSEGSTYKPSIDCTLYAVYSRTETTSGGGSQTTTFIPGTDNLGTGKNGITMSMSNTEGTSGYYQVYSGSAMSITSENPITSFVITCTAIGTSKYGPGNITFKTGSYSYSGTVGTWTGNATEIQSNNSTAQLRISKIVVTTSGGSSSTTYYHSTPDCTTETSVTLNPNGGTFASTPDGWIKEDNNYKKEDVTGAITLPTPTKTGYNFDGWYDDELEVNSPYTPSETVTLTAKWTAIQTTITLNANGGSGHTASVTATYDSNILDPSSITNPTQTGYTFDGWYSGEGGTGSLVINTSGKLQANVSGYTGANGVWKATTNKTLYAEWTPSVYTITYKDQGNADFTGDNEADLPATHTYGQQTDLVNATRSGYNFLGWFTTSDCSSSAITQLGATDYTDDITLYAKWEVAKTATSLTWSAASYVATIDVDNTFPTLTKSPADLSPIAYSSSNTGVATIDANGNITLVAAGTTTIIATFTETNTHAGSTASYTLTVHPSNCRWVEVTDNTTLEDGDEVVITMVNAGSTYALPNNPETSTPDGVPADGVINGSEMTLVANTLKWTVEKSEDNYIFHPNSDNSNWLYCIGSDNGVRVGTNEDKTFTIDPTSGYLKHIATSRYLRIGFKNYTEPVWRCYTTNTAGQTLKFYKRECLDASKVWIEGNLTNVTCDTQLPLQLAKDGSITLTFAATDGYALPDNVRVTNAEKNWDKSTGTLTISNPTANVTITIEALELHTVTWMVGSTIVLTETVTGGVTKTPADPQNDAIGDCADTFMGWSEKSFGSTPKVASDYSDLCTADEMKDKYTSVTEDKTFYAVFAKVEGGGESVTWKETFDTNEGTGGNDDQWSGTIATSELLSDHTWSFYNAKGADQCAKFASNSNGGSATTPEIDCGSSTEATLTFKAGSWKDDKTILSIMATNCTINLSSVNLPDQEWEEYTINITNITGKITINFSSETKKRFFLDEVEITSSGGTSYSDYITLCDNSKVWAKYDLNGGTGASACTQTLVTKDAPFNLCSETPTKDGYTFNGWSDGTKTYAAGAEVIISKTTTFYATWKANTVTITWDLNYADSPEAATSEYVYDGDEIEMPADPTRTGYTFTGWYTTSTGGTEITEVGEENKPTSDVTYYAHWLEQYTVTFYASGQVYQTQQYKYTSGDKLQLPENDPTAANFACDGYLFEGWSKYQQTKEDANRPELVDANTTIENDVELYAVWKKASASGAGTQIFYESFNTYNSPGGNEDGFNTASSNKDNNVSNSDNSGWSGNNVYGASACVKLGGGSAKGTITTPAIASLSGDATLSFKAAAWNGNDERTTLNLSISGGGSLDKTSVTLVKGAWQTYEVAITNGTPSSKVTFEAAYTNDNRFFLDEVIITTSGSYNYTTVPNCGPTMVAKENVWVTSANGQSVKVNVPLGIKLFEENPTITGTSTNENFVVNTLENVGNGEHNVVVVYTPTVEDIKENTTITLTAKNGEEIWSTTTFTLHGRSLPAEFVVVANRGDKNYALPANMTQANVYAGLVVEVSGEEVIAAPKSHLYNVRAVHSTHFAENGTALRLVGNNDACLWASNAVSGTSIRNWAKLANANTANYEWNLYTEDGENYYLSSSAVTEEGRVLRLYGNNFGMYKEGVNTFRFFPVGCTSTPMNVQTSTTRTSATISWTNASECNVVVKQGSTTVQSISAAASPLVVGNLAESTTYTFTLTPTDDASCGTEGSFTTTGPSIDIVEWNMGGIRIQVDKDEDVNPIIIINGEEEHGDVGGQVATELFFSKYFEAHGENKLLAVYNGTTQTIDLNGYVIKHGSVEIDLSQYGQTEGSIAPNEEIILVAFDDADDKSAESCAEKEEGFNTWNVLEKELLAFSGRGSVGLYKDDVLIDLIGSIYPSGELTKIGKAGKSDYCGTGDDVQLHVDGVSVNDQSSFFCYNGDNIKTPEVETDYPISTNRCLLIRKNSVTSGADAVASNKAVDGAKCGDLSSTFATLCSEWGGFRIGSGRSSDDEIQDATCEGLGYVGGFDYNNYYRTMETIYEGTKLENYDKNPNDNTYFIEFEVSKYACLNIQLQLTDDNGNVLTDQITQVPILVYDKKTTTDELFSAIVKDGETPDYENSKIRCATCDVVIQYGATLTKAAPGTENDVNQVRDIYVYPGGKLIIPEGANDYSVNSVSLRRDQDEVSAASIQTPLNITSSSKTPVYVDIRINSENWHWMTLPYNCNIADVTWNDGSKAIYNSDWFLMYYDGESRSKEQSHYENHWKVYEGTTIEAGKGYIVGITGHPTKSGVQYELRFPMAIDVLTADNNDKTVPVNAWGVEDDITPNKKGWNLVGNPYLDYYQRSAVNSFNGLRLGGEYEYDETTGKWSDSGMWDGETKNLPYIVIPVDGGWTSYDQVLASEIDLKPFTSYFVQVGNSGDTNGQQYDVLFTPEKRGRASLIQRSAEEIDEVEQPVIVGVTLSNSLGESDKTSLIIDDQYTDEYEMNADFFKWFGDYYTYYTKPVLYTVGADQGKRAFNALNEELATQPVALGMYAAQAGEYTFTLDLRSDLSHVEEIWLHDATENIYTNLLQDSYTFSTGKINGEGRFFLSVKMKPQQEPDPDPEPTPDPTPDSDPETSLDDIVANRVFATVKDNVIYISGLLSDAQLWIYDAAGRLMHYDQTKYYQHTYLVPQGGAYFVRVQGTMQTQTIKVVVK